MPKDNKSQRDTAVGPDRRSEVIGTEVLSLELRLKRGGELATDEFVRMSARSGRAFAPDVCAAIGDDFAQLFYKTASEVDLTAVSVETSAHLFQQEGVIAD